MIICWFIGHKYKQTKGALNGFLYGPVVCERCGKVPKRKITEVKSGNEHTPDKPS